MKPSRRDFVTWAAAGGITLSLSRLATAQPVDFTATQTLPGTSPASLRSTAGGRIDGFAKVTGAKLYASDFRASDMPGWPTQTSHALLVRSPDATHIFDGLDLDALPAAARPTKVVTAANLLGSGISVPAFYAGDLFCLVGETPIYLGQPVALLLFETFDAFDRARIAFRDQKLVRAGAETGPRKMPNYGAWRFTRVAGATPDAPDVYAPILEGWVSPGFFESSGRPIWKLLPDEARGPEYAKGARLGEQIRADLDTAGPDTLVLSREFRTQSVDPMFLEPECGLAWYDDGRRTLEFVVGSQSPFETASAVADLLGEAREDLRPRSIEANFAYVGGGFGGRDHSPFPLYVALAAMFFPGRPVRLAHDRFQQFQGGIKRHAIAMRSQIGIDRATGKITAFAADHVLDGGGLANYSGSVAIVAATGAIGIYDIPKVDVTTSAEHSRGVTAGSMRGYGTLQSMTALETLIDEVAAALPMDPIAFRRRNALKTGGRTMTGNPYSVTVRTPEILDRLERHAIWRDRIWQKQHPGPGLLVGTGIACVTKDYGTGADCSLGSVNIDAAGRVTIHADTVEMGNGVGTALARRVAQHLGGMAEDVTLAQVDQFDALDLVTTGDSYTMSQAEQDRAQTDTRWVPAISSPSSSSIGAHIGTHAAAEAARVVFRFGLWPAALELWDIPPDDPRASLWEEAFWQGEELLMSGENPLPLRAVAARAHARGGITGAMTHAFSRWAWARAAFGVSERAGDVPPRNIWTADIDALAVRRGVGGFERLSRRTVTFPPTDNNRIGTAFTSMCGTLVRVEIERDTGRLRIAKAYSVFECGQPLVPELVIGQAQGGFAMGVGYALLENLPPFEDGPGNGQWNLGDYLVARGSDLPLRDIEIELLPPVSARESPKGMAEVVMIPVVAALLNAIADATGKRFQSLPVTQAMIREALA